MIEVFLIFRDFIFQVISYGVNITKPCISDNFLEVIEIASRLKLYSF